AARRPPRHGRRGAHAARQPGAPPRRLNRFRPEPGPGRDGFRRMRRGIEVAAIAIWLALAGGAGAQPAAGESICLMIEAAADANGLPLEFFARVIWQESGFDPQAVGPLTRGGDRAQGIAQFMPRTASERRLLDPFDPVEALPKSADFLDELRNQFGNLGLAAAAYNAGPRRVQEWLAGTGPMPQETRNYIVAITG